MKELISLFSGVSIPEDPKPKNQKNNVAALNQEVALYGYTLDHKLFRALQHLEPGMFKSCRSQVLADLAEITGSGRSYSTLFNKFPYELPDQYEYLWKRLVGHFENKLGLKPNKDFEILSCGHVIDKNLFNLEDFGACPICQYQVDELDGQSHAKYPYEHLTPLKPLSYLTDDDLLSKGSAMLCRSSSLSKDERKFLGWLRSTIGSPPIENVAASTKVFKETLPYWYLFYGTPGVKAHLSGATDILRIACLLSNPEADLSLKEATAFKIKKHDQKALLQMLEDLPTETLLEDMLRERERWLRLFEGMDWIRARPKAWRKRFPSAFQAITYLRRAPEKIKTFSRTIEKNIRSQDITPKFLKTLASRPGEFARRLDFVIRTLNEDSFSHAVHFVDSDILKEALPKLKLRLLLSLRKYFLWRSSNPDKRVFIPKGQVNKMQVMDDNRRPIPREILVALVAKIEATIADKLVKLPSMGNVYVDPNLDKVLLPFNKRGDSSTNIQIPKGSRVPLGDPEVVRLFVWWKGEIDVDLSLVLYDKDFGVVDRIYWSDMNRAGTGMSHSGDIQSAPKGAAEFVDMDISVLRENRRARYAVASIISYRGEAFSTFPCIAGYMERDSLRSGEKFEPQSVALKYDVTAPTTSLMPLMIDLETMELIFADIASGSRAFSTIAGDSKYKAFAESVLNYPKSKVTLGDVIRQHVAARGSFATPSDMKNGNIDDKFQFNDPNLIQRVEELADAA